MTTNTAFLCSIDNKTVVEILNSIATNYQITMDEAMDEVMADNAEHLLEYLTGSIRTATSVLMKRHGF